MDLRSSRRRDADIPHRGLWRIKPEGAAPDLSDERIDYAFGVSRQTDTKV
jgi:hypothetical protein